MVCPNCHSDQIVSVQDQRFCISCGQMVPGELTSPLQPPSATAKPARKAPVAPPTAAEPVLSTAPTPTKPPAKRRPGRPKAQRLDTPRPLPKPPVAVAAELSTAASPNNTDAPAPPAKPSQRHLSDIRAPNRNGAHAAHAAHQAHSAHAKRPVVHKLEVPPLHYGHVLAASLRARAHPAWLALTTAAVTGLAAALGYGAWLWLSGGLPRLATRLAHAGPRVFAEAGVLAALYYIGRSIGQAAITYGVTREADHRPASLGRQISVGINTFGRRLALDLGVSLAQIALCALAVVLMLTGGANWPVNSQLQVTALFVAYLVLLYLIGALALTRGLAGVNLTLTAQRPWPAMRLGWRLFSHRFELLGLRFLALAFELVLALPLAVLAIGFIVAAPAGWHTAVAAAIGLLAWLAGGLLGAGTAAWWAALYRRLIEVDQPTNTATLLTGQPSAAPRPAPLALIVAFTSLLVAAALAIPWLKPL